MGMAAILVKGPWPRNLSNTSPVASEELFEILNIFPIQMYVAHTYALGSKLDLAIKRSNINVWSSF